MAEELPIVMRLEAAAKKRIEDAEEALTIAYMQGVADSKAKREALRAGLAAERARVVEECAAYLDSIHHNSTAELLRRALNKGAGDE
jgi:hypothetical protein